ncbi:MAG: PhzF family phenazine biosynthesis protein [Woeseiaceae bacterium]|nr:PhzF family phenazine biosynthesis protein [Woeseiaceae bacterium]
MSDLYKLAAFAETEGGGNPAGVWIGDALPDDAEMQRIAAEVGFSETAFIAPASGARRTVRYFSPEVEVPFCGHATIATGAVLGRRDGAGRYELDTLVGIVPINVREQDGDFVASLTSVEPRQRSIDDALINDILATLGWSREQLDDSIPVMAVFAGAWHIVIALRERETLAALDYGFDALKQLLQAGDFVTLQLIWRENESLYHSRNPFPVGGVVEDPATGAAAAALAGYLRAARLVDIPTSIVVRQGEDMGRPSVLHVDIPESGGIVVSGSVRDL